MLDAVDAKAYPPGIRTRRDGEIVFKLLILAVIDHVHARINIGEVHTRVGRDIAKPLLGIVPAQVIAFAR